MGKGGAIKICFWNVAGLLNKCDETWGYLGNFNIIELTETWIGKEKLLLFIVCI